MPAKRRSAAPIEDPARAPAARAPAARSPVEARRGPTVLAPGSSAGRFEGLDVVFFSAGAGTSRDVAPLAVKAGARVVDNSSAFRMDPSVPLVVPEINPDDVKRHQGIIANPNCTTVITLMALYPLHQAFGCRRIFASSYQAVSGTGAKAIAEVMDHSRGPKLVIFKKRRRQNSRRRNGHRQQVTVLRVAGIRASEDAEFDTGEIAAAGTDEAPVISADATVSETTEVSADETQGVGPDETTGRPIMPPAEQSRRTSVPSADVLCGAVSPAPPRRRPAPARSPKSSRSPGPRQSLRRPH